MIARIRWAVAAALVPFALASAMQVKVPRVSLPDRAAVQAWSAGLDRDLGPVMADCVRFEVTGHVAPAELDAMLARAGGDARLSPWLLAVTERAMARCVRRHGGPDDDVR